MNSDTQAGTARGEDYFDPFRLRPLATMNRRRFLIPQGIDDDIAGKTAYDVSSPGTR